MSKRIQMITKMNSIFVLLNTMNGSNNLKVGFPSKWLPLSQNRLKHEYNIKFDLSKSVIE